MRLFLAIAALLALVGYQRPDWVRGTEASFRQAASGLDGLGALLGLAPKRGTIAEQAKAAAPDRGTALAALDDAAEARQEAQLSKDPAARDQVQALLKGAAATLAGSEAMGELRSLQEARARLAALKEQAAMARIAGSDATALEADAARAMAELDRLAEAFAAKLAGLGVPVSREAAANLSVAANGDDVVALLGAYANIERIEGELRDAVARAPANEAAVRRYYAIHATLLAVLETVQAEVVSRIDTLYLPRLDSVDREARELRQDAQARLRTLRDPGLRAALEANLRAQDLTLQATGLYRRGLQEQRAGLAQALDRTRAARGVADNTARTAMLTLDVAGMVRETERDFGAVMAVRPPVPLPFEGEALRREFEGLSRRLGQQPTS